jgi:EAL domain-containing protein (putative c-di-GMP-specific phosphodiesterase class I)
MHTCRCRCDVPTCELLGIALFSEAPTVRERLATAFPRSEFGADVFVARSPEWRSDLSMLMEALSCRERDSIKAAPLREDGTFDPWTAGPLAPILGRLDTPWLPEMLNTDALRFDYQPIVDTHTMGIHGHECLVRGGGDFTDRTPGAIIEAARHHDAVLKFDQCARRLAILNGAPRLGDDDLLFVNFLPMTIYDPEVCLRTTFDAATQVGADFSRIVFEVVESEQFPDVDHLRAILDAYRARGARVGLDDLGAGNTALNFVARLKPDYVKLDRELIATAVASGSTAMVEGIVRYARDSGILIIAEGIETPEELAFAREVGADFVQGYLIARPGTEFTTSIEDAGLAA